MQGFPYNTISLIFCLQKMLEYSQDAMLSGIEQEKLSLMPMLNVATNPSLHSMPDLRLSKKEESNGKLRNNTKEQEEEQELIGKTHKIKRSKRNPEPLKENLNRGHWSLEENKKYHWFLEIHFWHFVNRHLRRMDKIFKSMEIFIDTRQAEQCRSHHQKMEKKYHNFKIIIQNLRLQHYDTLRSEPVRADMISNGIQVDSIVDASDLQVSEQQMSKDKKNCKAIRAFAEEQKEDVESEEQKCIQKSKVQEFDKEEVLDMLGDSQILRNFGEMEVVREEGQMFAAFDHPQLHDL